MSQSAIKNRNGRTRRAWVVHQILRSIFTGEFRGGDRLIEEEVAATIGVSRTPVREAFSELAPSIGLYPHPPKPQPRARCVVRPFGPTQIREMYQVRKLLEVEATRLAASAIEMQPLRAIHEKTLQYITQPRSANWSTDAVELDQQFHELIALSCGSTRLAEEIGRYRNLVQNHPPQWSVTPPRRRKSRWSTTPASSTPCSPATRMQPSQRWLSTSIEVHV